MAEKSIRVCGLNFRLGVSSLDVDAGCNGMPPPWAFSVHYQSATRYTAILPHQFGVSTSNFRLADDAGTIARYCGVYRDSNARSEQLLPIALTTKLSIAIDAFAVIGAHGCS